MAHATAFFNRETTHFNGCSFFILNSDYKTLQQYMDSIFKRRINLKILRYFAPITRMLERMLLLLEKERSLTIKVFSSIILMLIRDGCNLKMKQVLRSLLFII
jgi:hypothetical protein